jgi:hypothetical protein
MIDEILKEDRVGKKPRFFLHDEVKAWLSDNLQINILVPVHETQWVQSVANMDQPYYNRYVETVAIPSKLSIISMITCDGQTVGSSHYSEIDLSEYAKVIKASCKRIDELEANNRQLGENQVVMQNELVELKKELDLLKQK